VFEHGGNYNCASANENYAKKISGLNNAGLLFEALQAAMQFTLL
jgi:hypothetical protein